MSTDPDQIELAKKLLKTVRHAAYATINEDLTKLYVGSYSESLHCKNFVRTGRAFAVLFDSFTKGQGGVYITGMNVHECEGDELVEALRVHNTFRAKHGSQPIDIVYYQATKPSQRMYSIDIAKIEIYSAVRGENGLVVSEARVPVDARVLLGSTA